MVFLQQLIEAQPKGGVKMQFKVDIDELKTSISKSGISMTKLSQKANINRNTLYNRLNGVGEFTASEIGGIAYALRLSESERDAIFFAHKV